MAWEQSSLLGRSSQGPRAPNQLQSHSGAIVNVGDTVATCQPLPASLGRRPSCGPASSTSTGTTSTSTCAACSRVTSGPPPRRSRSPATRPVRRRSSTCVGDVRRSDAQRPVPRRGHATSTAGCPCPTWPPTTSWSSSPGRPTPPPATASCAPSTPPTSWSTSGRASSATRLAGPGPASTSPTSRPCTGSSSTPTRAGPSPATPPPTRSTDLDDGGRRWTFADTPRLSTYVTVVNAGPFHEIRSQRGAHDLGLFCRQSLRSYLERDAEELFDLTDRGLRFFGEQFGRPFAQERYDQVFVPNMGGAMENWGCVTWSDASIYRTRPDPLRSGPVGPTSCSTRWRTSGSATW